MGVTFGSKAGIYNLNPQVQGMWDPLHPHSRQEEGGMRTQASCIQVHQAAPGGHWNGGLESQGDLRILLGSLAKKMN